MSKFGAYFSGGSREEPGRTDPLFWLKKEEITEGKKTSKPRKSRPAAFSLKFILTEEHFRKTPFS